MATPFPFVAGNVLTAAQMNSIGEVLTFTPTITSGGTFTIGNGSLSGRYIQVNTLVVVEYSFTWGSTTNDAGSGEWLFSVPIPFGAFTVAAGGAGIILDAGATYYRCTAASASGKIVFQGNDSGNRISKTNPMTWATNDNLQAVVSYEV